MRSTVTQVVLSEELVRGIYPGWVWQYTVHGGKVNLTEYQRHQMGHCGICFGIKPRRKP